MKKKAKAFQLTICLLLVQWQNVFTKLNQLTYSIYYLYRKRDKENFVIDWKIKHSIELQ